MAAAAGAAVVRNIAAQMQAAKPLKSRRARSFSILITFCLFARNWRCPCPHSPRLRRLCSLELVYTHTRFTALYPGLPGWAGTRKVKPIWILLKQETVSGSGISWAICKSAPRSRQITTPAPHHSVFYRPDAPPVAQPTASMHWRLFRACLVLRKYCVH